MYMPALSKLAAPGLPAEATTFISPWCRSSGKRLMDFTLGGALLIITLPLMMVIAVAVKLTSPGPVFFRQRRLGKDGVTFELLKFRSMTEGASSAGPGITRKNDPRVTWAGKYLRQWKLDELPQLWNVITGEMSLVGPRPDLPKYFAALGPGLARVLLLRPGVTGEASIRFRHEEDLLSHAPADGMEDYYITRLLPVKIRADLGYAEAATFFTDVALLFRTILAVFRLPVRTS